MNSHRRRPTAAERRERARLEHLEDPMLSTELAAVYVSGDFNGDLSATGGL